MPEHILCTILYLSILPAVQCSPPGTHHQGDTGNEEVEIQTMQEIQTFHDNPADPYRDSDGGLREEKGFGRAANICAGVLLLVMQILLTSALYVLMGWNMY